MKCVKVYGAPGHPDTMRVWNWLKERLVGQVLFYDVLYSTHNYYEFVSICELSKLDRITPVVYVDGQAYYDPTIQELEEIYTKAAME